MTARRPVATVHRHRREPAEAAFKARSGVRTLPPRRPSTMDWTLETLLRAAGVDARASGDVPVSGLTMDSRSVVRGDIYACVPGSTTDGHDFAAAAVASGAVAILAEREVGQDVPQVVVPSVRDVLGPLAHEIWGRPSEALPVAGVTGTNGKTTVTYLVEAIASAAGAVPGVIGSIDRRAAGRTFGKNPLNTPEAPDLHRTLAEMRDAGATVVVMEVTSGGLVYGRVRSTRFACAAFTNLTQDHREIHATMEDYFQAKASLFTTDYTSRAVVNTADEWGRRLAAQSAALDVLTFGGSGADLAVENVEMGARETAFTLVTPDGRTALRTPLVGSFNVENVLCAGGIALHLGFGLEAIAAGVAQVRVPGRLEPVDSGQPFAVLVDYAHTPDALERVLDAARSTSSGRLIVVFGCGGDRDRVKRPIMGEAATRRGDFTVITSDNPRSEEPQAIIDEIIPGAVRGGGKWTAEPDRRRAIAEALHEARPGDVVVIAGKGHEQGQTAAGRTVPFDDRTVALQVLEQMADRTSGRGAGS